MLITNTTEDRLQHALNRINKYGFNNNLKFRQLDHAGYTSDGGEKWKVRIQAIDSAKAGGRRAANGRRIGRVACWHVHGHFLSSLNREARLTVTCGDYGRMTLNRYSNWPDWNVGTKKRPLPMSEACECNGPFQPRLFDQYGRQLPGRLALIANAQNLISDKNATREHKHYMINRLIDNGQWWTIGDVLVADYRRCALTDDTPIVLLKDAGLDLFNEDLEVRHIDKERKRFNWGTGEFGFEPDEPQDAPVPF